MLTIFITAVFCSYSGKSRPVKRECFYKILATLQEDDFQSYNIQSILQK